jgi:hypothetical protein
MTQSTQPRQRRSGLGTSLWMSLNPLEHLWRDMTISVQWHSPSNLTELESICKLEWEKLPKYRCAKLVASYPRRLEAVIAAKGASTKFWVKGLNSYVNMIFLIFCSKNLFLGSLWGIVMSWWGIVMSWWGIVMSLWGFVMSLWGIVFRLIRGKKYWIQNKALT